MAGGAPIPVREYTDAAEMRRHAAEVRARMFAPRPAPAPTKKLVQVAVKTPAANAWSKPKVKQISFIPAEAIAAEAFKNPSFHPIRRMTDMVAFMTGVTVKEMMSDRRMGQTCKARQILFYLCKTYTRFSLPEIGRRIGDKDHTTVLHGVRRVQDAINVLDIETVDNPIVMASTLWAADWPKWAR